jgi:ribonuclease R
VCELARRGRLLVGEPYFDPRTAIVLDRATAGGAEVGDLIVVATHGRGRARVERVIGASDHIAHVLEGVLYATGMKAVGDRGELAEREADLLPQDPDGVEAGRVDLRDVLTFTIDPDEAKDFDDAISIARENGGVRVWVHIADVARYVAPGTALDRQAAERAVSVYVPGLVEPMLPERLSNGLCSLVPDRDRNTITIEVPFDSAFEPGVATFYRSVIRSNARLTYTSVEEVLAGGEPAEPALAEALRLSDDLSQELRRRRELRGALRIQTKELAFSFDDRGGVERAWMDDEPRAHALVEELMILANEAVAALLSSRRREALYRVHERPDPQSIELLLSKLDALEVPSPPAPEHLTAETAERLAAAISDRVTDYVAKSDRGREAFPSLVLRSLKQARYDQQNLGHSGLASSAYCHFTSPIRRYPDLVCHRALLRELGVSDDPPAEDLGDIAEWASAREREAAQVEHFADAICLAWLLDRRLYDVGWDAELDGEVVGAIGSGIFVRFDGVFEGYLPARRLGDDYYELDPLGIALVGRRTGRQYRLGDPIRVRVERIDRPSGKVELSPV